MSRNHVVVPGDCIESIAFRYGFFPDALWMRPENEALRQQRDRHVLQAGDIVFIPDLEEKMVPAATGARHRFRRRGVPARFHVVLRHHGEPRAGVAYTLVVDGRDYQGQSGADGSIEHWIPPDAKRALLRISEREAYEFELGGLTPTSDEAGVRARLENLGYLDPGDEDAGDEDDEDLLIAAVKEFQCDHGIAPADGELDDRTRVALVVAHGS